MKKALALTVAFVAVILLAGCPAEMAVTAPDERMGTVVVDCDLSVSDDSKGGGDPWRQIGDLLKSRIHHIDFNFRPLEDGLGVNGSSFTLDVVNRRVQGEFWLYPGEYHLYVYAMDYNNYNALFVDEAIVTIVAGRSTVLNLLLQFNSGFNYRFTLPCIGGDASTLGYAFVHWPDHQELINYRNNPQFGGWLVFEAWLPLDFNINPEGLPEPVYLTVEDMATGHIYVTELNFTIFDAVDGLMEVPCIFPSFLGGVDVQIGFEYEQ